MPGEEVLLGLAAWAGTTVAAAAVTDAWEAARDRIARLLGRGDARKTEITKSRMEKTREKLVTAGTSTELEQARTAAAGEWKVRFADLLEEEPDLEGELHTLIEEIAAKLPAITTTASATGHSVAAGRDATITATDNSVAAGVIHGNVGRPDPTPPGPAQP